MIFLINVKSFFPKPTILFAIQAVNVFFTWTLQVPPLSPWRRDRRPRRPTPKTSKIFNLLFLKKKIVPNRAIRGVSLVQPGC